jgi:hypothetical protein
MRVPLRSALPALLLLLSFLPKAWAGNPGDAGFLSLRMGVGARNAAMGDVGVAESSGSTAMYYNPANMVYADGTELTLQHLEHFSLFRQEAAALSHQTPHGAIGLIFSGFYSESLQRTTVDRIGVDQGEFRPYQLAVGLGYAYLFHDFSVGLVGKFLYERIDAYGASGLALDLGISHRTEIPGLTLAAAIANLGGQMTLKEEPYDLPLTTRLGASYTPQVEGEGFAQNLTVAADLVLPNDGNGRLHTGAEVRLHQDFTLRAGYRFNYDTYGLTAGLGYRKGSLALDYAFMDNGNNLEDNHRISLTFAFMP